MESTSKRLLAGTLICFALGGCANMSPRDRNTAIGAAVGGVTGSALTNGDSFGTVGGAVVGGVIGNRVTR